MISRQTPLRSFPSFATEKTNIMAFKTLRKVPEGILDKATNLAKATALMSYQKMNELAPFVSM